MSKVKSNFMVHRDHNSRTCIEVNRDKSTVQYIPMEISGFNVSIMEAKEFDRTYKPMVNYPIDQACKLYAQYAVTLGATKEALDYLGQVITITQSEYDMATKKIAAATKPVEKKPVVKATEKKPVVKATEKKPVVKATEKKPVAKATEKKPVAKATEKKSSASAMFKELIMAGKLSDDGIFAAVQKEFGLADNKRYYVGWYRGDLKRKGMNPPEPR